MCRQRSNPIIAIGMSVALLAACGGGDDQTDVDSFISDVRNATTCDELLALDDDLDRGLGISVDDLTAEEKDLVTRELVARSLALGDCQSD